MECGLEETLFLVRTKTFGPMASMLADRLASSGAEVAIVVDERSGPVATGKFPKVSLSDDILTTLGFSNLAEDWPWFCGDLCYAAALERFPEQRAFVLIESDVFIPELSVEAFVDTLASHPADAIAAQLSQSGQRRRFSDGLARFGLDPEWGCIFPVTRVTQQVARAMNDLRMRQLKEAPNARLNDEAILAGAVQRGQFSYARLEDVLPDLVQAGTFDTNPPHLLEALEADGAERRIFHPVVPFERIMERLLTGEKNYTRHRLRMVLAAAPKPMKREINKFLRRLGDERRDKRPGLLRLNSLVGALAPERRIRVIDVGANPLIEGEVSYQRLLDQGHAEVAGFEPQEDALAALNERKSAAETYLPYALGDGGEATLRLTRAPGFSSVFPADTESARLLGFTKGMSETGRMSVQTRRLDDLDELLPADFLKIDVQGSETAILRNGREKLADALVIQTEVRLFSIYRDEPTYGELEEELSAQGFRFLRFASLKHVPLSRNRYRKRLRRAEFSQAVDGDAFFVRDLTQIGAWSDETIKRLAILADGVMDSPDLAIFALDHLVMRGVLGSDVVERYIEAIPADRRRT